MSELNNEDIEEAIMYAFARPFEPNLQLHEDDVEGIQVKNCNY